MRIDYLLDKIKDERERYYRSKHKSDQGRFYILDRLYHTIEDLEHGFDEDVIRSILKTLSNIQIDGNKQLSAVSKSQYKTDEPVFRIPVFPITFDKNNVDEDLLTEIFRELEHSKHHWLCSIPQEQLRSDPNIKNWQREMITGYKRDVSRNSNFTDFPISFLRRSCSNYSKASLESQIQDYISNSNLPQEGKLPAFHFITRCGGSEMKDLLDSTLESQFGNTDLWQKNVDHEINWTYNSEKLPMCDAHLNVAINSNSESDEDEEENDNRARHDPRFIGANHIITNKEPDLKIRSKTTLTWLNETIIPYVNSITISGQYTNLLPMIMKDRENP